VFQHPDWQPFASAVQLADTSLTVQQQQATLLQQVLPQVSAAIYNSCNFLLQQGARINVAVETTLDGRLAKLEGGVKCLINSQLGAAQLLAGQLSSVNAGAAQPVAGQFQLPLFALALQPAAAEPTTQSTSTGPPAYNFISARTVGDVWREYKERIAGGPAVEELERQWQARWRPTTAQRTAWSRRKLVIDEVERLIRTGLAPADAVAVLEDQRGSLTLRNLQNRLIAQKLRRVPAGRPKGNGKAQGGRSG
jgi:hypothetical protein